MASDDGTHPARAAVIAHGDILPGPGPGAAVRRQVGGIARTALRPHAWLGAAREVALSAFHLATYPLGVAPVLQRHEVHYSATSLAQLSLLASDPATACTPVLLVHGWFHNRSAFLVMSRALKRAGFQHVHDVNYNPVLIDIPAAAALLAAEVERVLERCGADRCMIVGHSMGGLVARMYVQDLGGEDTVDTVITLGTPHRGTYSAYLGVGPAAAQMRPGSDFMRRLEGSARPSDVRYVAYWSDLDALVIPAVHAKLVHPALQATDIKLRDTGHLSLLLSGEVLRGVVEWLAHRDVGRPAPVGEVTSMPSGVQRRRRVTPATGLVPGGVGVEESAQEASAPR